jgi:hypothetical protein
MSSPQAREEMQQLALSGRHLMGRQARLMALIQSGVERGAGPHE